MSTRKALCVPSLPELNYALVTFPEGTLGHQEELRMIASIHDLCMKHGFGRVHQVVQAVHDIWRQNEDAAKHIQFYAELRKLLQELANKPV